MARLHYLCRARAVSVLVVLAAGGCAITAPRIPPPQFNLGDASYAARKAMYEKHRITPSDDASVVVGAKKYPLKSLPRYFEESQYYQAAASTRHDFYFYTGGALLTGGFIGLGIAFDKGFGDQKLADAAYAAAAVLAVTWVYRGWPANPRRYIPGFNDFLKNKLNLDEKD